ncbi:MAG: dienelactone hydrolase family protein [Actinomycetota bacterium]
MAEIVLFHHALGLTAGVEGFADILRRAGHVVHVPDLFDGRTFDSLDDGVAHFHEVGADSLLHRARTAVEGLPEELVYAGISLGVIPAQLFAQTRPGARGALFFEACLPADEFGEWPEGVPVQVHGNDADPRFAGDGDLDAARALVSSVPDGELFLYPGDQHLFGDFSLPSYDEPSAALLAERVLSFLERVG